MYKYFISFVFSLLFSCLLISQNQDKNISTKDTAVYKTAYGIRLGIDLSKPLLSIVDKSYKGIELLGDYRISKRWYIAAELGYEKETSFEDFTTSSAKGSFIRLGANYNAYRNWLNMNNEIYLGVRYGLALFEHSLLNFTPNVATGIENLPPYFPSQTVDNPTTGTRLSAHWTEIQLGIKVQVFKNLFLNAGFSSKIILSISNLSNFKTLYSPGFNRVYQNNTGFGFFYTISYLIPFVNK
ncbi:MAG: DUF6048 family protein [Tenacibaculum sp.]